MNSCTIIYYAVCVKYSSDIRSGFTKKGLSLFSSNTEHYKQVQTDILAACVNFWQDGRRVGGVGSGREG